MVEVIISTITAANKHVAASTSLHTTTNNPSLPLANVAAASANYTTYIQISFAAAERGGERGETTI